MALFTYGTEAVASVKRALPHHGRYVSHHAFLVTGDARKLVDQQTSSNAVWSNAVWSDTVWSDTVLSSDTMWATFPLHCFFWFWLCVPFFFQSYFVLYT